MPLKMKADLFLFKTQRKFSFGFLGFISVIRCFEWRFFICLKKNISRYLLRE